MKKTENIYTRQNPLYRNYIENGNSVAIAITKYNIKSIETKAKWVDIIDLNGEINHFNKNMWDFSSFKVEIFPRKTKPIYHENASQEEIDYITWETATKDITKLRSNGYKGPKYEIKLNLVNANEGKYKTVEGMWNNTFQCWVPMQWKTSSCVIKKRHIPLAAKWEYRILSVKKIR